MNKTINWIIVAIVAFGAVWYLASQYSPGSGEVPTTTIATTTTSAAPSIPTTPTAQKPAPKAPTGVVQPPVTRPKVAGSSPVAYLFGLKQSLECSITTSGAMKKSGTLYISGTQMRVDFSGSSMISDGTYLYAWMKGASKGLKLLASSSVSGSAMATNGGFDPGTDISFGCNPWTENLSFFVPPTLVSFSNSL